MVEGCTRTKQTFWTEDEFTVTVSSGIRNRVVRVSEIVVRDLEKDKPDKWGFVQARDLWSPQEERQVRPGHFWMLKFDKVAGSNSCVEKKFNDQRKSQLHHFTIGFQKPGICADAWFLESNGKMVQLGFSLSQPEPVS